MGKGGGVSMNHTRGPFTTSIFTAELSEEHDDVWGCDCIILYFLRPLIIIIVLFYYQTRITFSSNILFLPFEALALRWASFLLQHFNFEYPSFSPKLFFLLKIYQIIIIWNLQWLVVGLLIS